MALTSRPDDARPCACGAASSCCGRAIGCAASPDYEARLDIAGERYAPDLPRWHGQPLDGPLLIYPEQLDIESDAARRDTLMLARGVDAVVQCVLGDFADWLNGPTVRRGESLVQGFAAAAALSAQPAVSWLKAQSNHQP